MKANIIKKERVFDSFFKIDAYTFQKECYSGGMSDPQQRLVFERGDAVAALIKNTDPNHFFLAKQFRCPTFEKGPGINGQGWIREIVTGSLKEGKDPEAAMKRELIEEIGFDVPKLDFIGYFYVSPGGTSERIFLYYGEVSEANRVSEGGGLAEEGEDIRLVSLAPEELWNLFSKGQLVDAKSIIALLWSRLGL